MQQQRQLSVHWTESWMVVDAAPASFSKSHVKLAPLSSRLSRMSSTLDVVPNLTGVGKTVTPALSCAPLRYHVTFGAGFPPVDSHVNRMCSDSRGSRDDTLVDMVGAPGVTAHIDTLNNKQLMKSKTLVQRCAITYLC